jgi:hypothetical protein
LIAAIAIIAATLAIHVALALEPFLRAKPWRKS